MIIKTLASSSKGNAYIVSDGITSILLEAGITIKELRKKAGFRLYELSACLVTHEHKDHSKACEELLKHGLDVYMTKGTAEALGIKNANIIQAKKSFRVGSFTVLPFDTQHDCAEPVGFLIESNFTKERLLFATDTYYIKYRFSGLDYIMVECNYDLDILNANVEAGKLPLAMKNRVLKSHFSIENVVKFLQANDLKDVVKIYLLHLSDGNSNETQFKERIEKEFYKEVEVCRT